MPDLRTAGLALLGLLVGLVGWALGALPLSAVEPGGRYVACGPALFGRPSPPPDPGCGAAYVPLPGLSLALLAVAVMLLALAVAMRRRGRGLRQPPSPSTGPARP